MAKVKTTNNDEAMISMRHKEASASYCGKIGIGRRHEEDGKINKFDILDYDYDII